MKIKIKTKLLDYQKIAYNKLKKLLVSGLFMEMGTGKTRTAIEFIVDRLNNNKINRVIYFCPVSIKQTIKDEFIKHTNINIDDIYKFDNKTNKKNIQKALIYIIGIESISNSLRNLSTVEHLIDDKSMVIVDESSYIKGHLSKRSRYITQMSRIAKYRMILTGTPISQGIVDLYSQFRFLSSKILGYNSFYAFQNNHLVYSDEYPNLITKTLKEDYIAYRINPFIYQIKKEECLDLPKKIYEKFYFDMSNDQLEYYAETKDYYLKNLDYNKFNSYSIFVLFSKLQQIVCGFLNTKNKCIEIQNNRLNILDEILSYIPENEKIIIWCKYEHDIKIITNHLGEENVALYYGKINEKNRLKSISDFTKNKKYFVVTQATGGHGLNDLIIASHVIYFNNEFKYSNRMQSEDRTHRIGQNKSVIYYDIICDESIDNRIMNSINNKKNVVVSFKSEIDKIKDDKKAIKNMIKNL